MRLPCAAALISTALLAQGQEGFDPLHSGAGWARMDKDGSITFHDPATQSLRTWSRDGGEMGSVSLARLEGVPEKWVIDIYGNAWVVSGGNLFLVEAKSGKVSSKDRLPGEVSDLAWDVRGFVLAYRGAEPYIEKREYRNGNVLWSYGAKPKRGGGAVNTYRTAVSDDGQVLFAGGGGLPLTVLDGAKGKVIGQTAFSFNGIAAPDLILGEAERGPLVMWTGKNLAFASVTGRQVPEAKMNGTLLARLDLGQSALEFLPTGLAEGHFLVGVHEGVAFFMKPGGGMVTVPVR